MSSSKTTGEVRPAEDNIGASATRRADFTGRRDIRPLTAGFGLANARPLVSIIADEPVIGWMPG